MPHDLLADIIAARQLIAVVGNVAFVTLLMRVAVKPYLRLINDLDNTPSPAAFLLYRLQMNVAAALLGVLFAAVTQLWLLGWTVIGLLTTVLVGIAGGFGAIGLHETATNFLLGLAGTNEANHE